MIDGLRALYQEELQALREDAEEFSRHYPRIAPMLGLRRGETADPMAERMLEATAWMAARIRQDSQAGLPLAAQQILSLLYPNFAAPIPSVSIAALEPDAVVGGSFPDGVDVPAGTVFASGPEDDSATIWWRTAWPMRLSSVSVLEAEILPQPPVGLAAHPGRSCLRLRTTPLRGMSRLRLFLSGDSYLTYPLHDWAHMNVVDVLVSSRHGEGRYVSLGAGALRPGGLDEEDKLFDCGDFALPAYHMLQEYFVCPERFLFWDLGPLRGHNPEGETDILIVFGAPPPRRFEVDPDVFVANAVPVVNMFERLAEPIHVDHRRPGYLLRPDQRRRDTTEIHSILSLEALTPGGEPRAVKPYFSLDGDGRDDGLYWFSRRRPSIGGRGTDVQLYFKDRRQGLGESRPYTVVARVLCTNRGHAAGLGVATRLRHNTELPLAGASLLRPPTPQHNPPMFGDELCKLVSGISLHQVSLLGKGGLNALREIMRLYAPPGDQVSRVQIGGVAGLESYADTHLLRPTRSLPMGGAARGLEIRLLLDEEAFLGTSLFIFGSVMDVFFGLFSDLNSFTRLRLYTTARRKELHSWPARNGYRNI